MNYIFLSYSHKDVDTVMKVSGKLSEEYKVVYDTNIGAAREYNNEIADMIDNCKITIAFISENFLKSSYCIDEILYARSKEVAIVLVYLDDAELVSGLKLRLNRFQSIHLKSANFWEKLNDIDEIKACRLVDKKEDDTTKEGKIEFFNTDKDFYLVDVPGNSYLSQKKNRWENAGKWPLAVNVGYSTDEDGKQNILEINYSKNGHYLITGISQSGKSTLAQTILYGLINKYDPSELNCYIIDMDNYMYECIKNAPHVGVVINENSTRRISFLLYLLEKKMQERRNTIRTGDIQQYNSTHAKTLPAIVIVIDNFEKFWGYCDEKKGSCIAEIIRDGARYGIYMMVLQNSIYSIGDYAGPTSINKIMNCFKNRILFEQLYGHDYAEDLGMVSIGRQYFGNGEKIESLIAGQWKSGKGIYNIRGNIGKFATAIALAADNIYVREQMIEKECGDMRKGWKGPVADELSDVPDNLDKEMFFNRSVVKEELKNEKHLPYGLYVETGEVASLDLDKTYKVYIHGGTSANVNFAINVLFESARQRNAEIFYYDVEGREGFRIEDEKVRYANNRDDLYEHLEKDFMPMIKMRNKCKNELRKQGASDQEIAEAMDGFVPMYLFIADYNEFIDKVVYSSEETRFRAFFENIIEKGAGHKFYIIAGATKYVGSRISEHKKLMNDSQGLVVGGSISDQRIVDFYNVGYAIQAKNLPNTEAICSSDSTGRKIKIPM